MLSRFGQVVDDARQVRERAVSADVGSEDILDGDEKRAAALDGQPVEHRTTGGAAHLVLRIGCTRLEPLRTENVAGHRHVRGAVL